MRDIAYPAAYGLKEAQVAIGKEVRLRRLCDECAAPCTCDIQGHPDLRSHTQRALDAHQLVRIVLHSTAQVRLTALKDFYRSATVRDGLTVETDRRLVMTHRGVARADGHQ